MLGVDASVPQDARDFEFQPDMKSAANLGRSKPAAPSAVPDSSADQLVKENSAPGSRQRELLEMAKKNSEALWGDPSYRALGGGVQRFAVKSTTVSGSTATVVATCYTWKSFLTRDGQGSWRLVKPGHDKTITATLVTTERGWQVSDIGMLRADDQLPPSSDESNR